MIRIVTAGKKKLTPKTNMILNLMLKLVTLKSLAYPGV
jgi:hypothetical protein